MLARRRVLNRVRRSISSSRLKFCRRLQCARQRLLAVIGTDLDSVRRDELKLRDADESEYAAQVTFEMFEGCCGRAGPVVSAARDRNDHPLVAG